jgi:hypothetical protein
MLALLAELLDSFTYGLVAVVSEIYKVLCSDSEAKAINTGICFEDLAPMPSAFYLS